MSESAPQAPVVAVEAREPSPRVGLFAVDRGRSDLLLARTLHGELVRGGRSRSEILAFVNALLGFVLEKGRGSQSGPPPLDPQTGLPTRSGFHQLVLHELDPDEAHGVRACVLLLDLPKGLSPSHEAVRLSHFLRATDVVAPMGPGRLAALLYIRHGADWSGVLARLWAGRAQGRVSFEKVAAEPLEHGAGAKVLWARLHRSLRSGGLEPQ